MQACTIIFPIYVHVGGPLYFIICLYSSKAILTTLPPSLVEGKSTACMLRVHAYVHVACTGSCYMQAPVTECQVISTDTL